MSLFDFESGGHAPIKPPKPLASAANHIRWKAIERAIEEVRPPLCRTCGERIEGEVYRVVSGGVKTYHVRCWKRQMVSLRGAVSS